MRRILVCVITCTFVMCIGLIAQVRSSTPARPTEAANDFYSRWVNEDVRWIITDQELAEWKKLSSNAEKDRFIEQFWKRRDPTPDTEENEYKEEHYRHMAYANEHFAAPGVSGWRTDRGRMYVMYGKPDAIEAHPLGEWSKRADGRSVEIDPFEIWRYRYLEGIGQEIEVQFVDPCRCGEYHMVIDKAVDKLVKEPGTVSDASDFPSKSTRAPEVKFKDLEAVVKSKVRYNLLPVDGRLDFIRVTADTDLVPITLQIQNHDLTFADKEGVKRAAVNIFGRFTTPTGRIVTSFEDSLRLDVPAELLEKVKNNVALYWKALPLTPGPYRLDIAIKDVNGDKLGTFGQSISVPEFNPSKLTSSTLIIADVLEPVPSRETGTGNFVIGTTKVRPKLPPSNGAPVTFKRELNSKVNFWMQVYNLAIDPQTHKPLATVEYEIVNTGTNKPVVDVTERSSEMGALSDQLTLGKSLPISKLDPAVYQVMIKITDLVGKQSIAPTANFVIQ